MQGDNAGLIVAANRLPLTWDESSSMWRPSPGGLVSALEPVLSDVRGTWVGWTGVPDAPHPPFDVDGVHYRPVALSADELEEYYLGFCNATTWPLYHDAIRPPEFHRHWWRPYRAVNRRFAEVVARAATVDDRVWIHDYQLQLVPALVREMARPASIGFFLHIPFPPPEVFARLPWRTEVLEGLLGADHLGFQTRRSVRNFAACARLFAGAHGPADALSYGGRLVRAEANPISIDVDAFARDAIRPDVGERAARLRLELGSPGTVLLGVDRLDYTKGIDLRLRAYETILDRRPELVGRVVFVQIAVPSREGAEQYQQIRDDIERLVGRINGTYGRPGWMPVHYMYRAVPRDELVAFYVASDVMVVTPLRDGMNLVAKEYIVCRARRDGVLVLSEFAGAAEQLRHALIANPYDVDELASLLGSAIDMPLDEQRSRMVRLRRAVRQRNVHVWARHALGGLGL